MKLNPNREANSVVRNWMRANLRLANFLAAWLFFVLEIVVAKFVGDLDIVPVDFRNSVENNPGIRILITATPLAILSIVNIYGVPALARWFISDKRAKATRLAVFGAVFGSFFCCPVLAVGFGIATMTFMFVTIVHAFVKLNNAAGLNSNEFN